MTPVNGIAAIGASNIYNIDEMLLATLEDFPYFCGPTSALDVGEFLSGSVALVTNHIASSWCSSRCSCLLSDTIRFSTTIFAAPGSNVTFIPLLQFHCKIMWKVRPMACRFVNNLPFWLFTTVNLACVHHVDVTLGV